MDMMEVRRRMMLSMGGRTRFVSGTITIEEDTTTLSIGIGIVPRVFVIFVSEKELTAGVRNFGGLSHVEENGAIYELALSSNAAGNSWSGATLLNVDDTATQYALTINGTQVDINTNKTIGSAHFLAGKTYKWLAYA